MGLGSLVSKANDWLGASAIGEGWNDITGATEMQQNAQSFQERMSNTAYQRAVADMEKAGINPALAYMNGGASTPTGAGSGAAGGNLIQAAFGVGQVLTDAMKSISQARLNSSSAKLQEATAAKERFFTNLLEKGYDATDSSVKQSLADGYLLRSVNGDNSGITGSLGVLGGLLGEMFNSSPSSSDKVNKSSGNSAKTVKDPSAKKSLKAVPNIVQPGVFF